MLKKFWQKFWALATHWGTLSMHSFCRSLLLFLKIDIRIVGMIGIIGTILSLSLMADWQAIPYDSCTEKSPFHHPDIIYNSTLAEYNTWLSHEVVATHTIQKRVLTEQQTFVAIEECENATFGGHQCHWIPKSNVIPSFYCKDCQPICRSPLRSLSFIPFSIGLVLIYILYPLNKTAPLALLSDNASKSTLVRTISNTVKPLN